MTQYTRIPKKVQEHIFGCFVDDMTAKKTASQAAKRWKKNVVSRVTVNAYFRHYRECIRASSLNKYPRFTGEVEIDIGFIGGRAAKWQTQFVQRLLGLPVGRIVAKRKEAIKQKAKKRPVLGILNRGGNIILLPLESRARKYLEGAVRMIVEKGSVVYTDMEKGLDGLKFDGYIHRQVNHSKQHVDRHGYHLNGIESFWRECRGAMSKNFRGIPRSTIDLHIKEREFRYNNRGDIEKAMRAVIFPKVQKKL